MITFIGIESLAANAIIELMRRDDTREVSFDMLVRYGMQIVRILKERNDEEAVLLLSEKYQIPESVKVPLSKGLKAISGNGLRLFRLSPDG